MESSPKPERLNRWDGWIALFLFLLIVVTQFNSEPIHSGDTRWYIPTALSLVHEGNTDLDEFQGMIVIPRDHGVRRYGEHLYNWYPIGPTLMALPFVYILDNFAAHVFDMDLYAKAQKDYPARLESAIAVCIAALAVIAVYFLCRLYLDRRWALIPTLLFAYGMNTWSTASQSLWQHGPSMLVITLALYFLIRADQDDRWVYAAASPLFFSYAIRPTNAVPVVLFSLYVFARYRRHFPLFVGLGLITLVPLFADCYVKSGQLLDRYYLFASTTKYPRWDGLPGTLISPGRGLFIYSPVLLFSLVGLWLKVRRKQLRSLDLAILMTIVAHWISISLFSAAWWGGHCVGPRYFTDMNPFFAFYFIPLFERPVGVKLPHRVGIYALLGILTLISGWIQWRCAKSWEVLAWSAFPIDVGDAPSRLWDWHDVPFLRGIQVVHSDMAPVSQASILFAPYKTNARFGGMIALRGYEVRAAPLLEGVNGKVIVRLYWQALRPPDFDYSVFVHVLDAEGHLVTQSDHAPGEVAGYPPTLWRRGQVVVDEHIVPIPEHLVSGSYAIKVGVYNWITGERLLLEGGQGDAMRLSPTITILPQPSSLILPCYLSWKALSKSYFVNRGT